jgi:hypothetical protein
MCHWVLIIRSVRSPLRIIVMEACADNVQDGSLFCSLSEHTSPYKEGPPLWTHIQEMAYHDPTE